VFASVVLFFVNQPQLGLGLGSLCNDGCLPEYNNCKYVRIWNPLLCRHQLVLKALRDIQPGQELLVSYGRGYWRSAIVAEEMQKEEDSSPEFGLMSDSDEPSVQSDVRFRNGH
jgi:SET domain-containing protein